MWILAMNEERPDSHIVGLFIILLYVSSSRYRSLLPHHILFRCLLYGVAGTPRNVLLNQPSSRNCPTEPATREQSLLSPHCEGGLPLNIYEAKNCMSRFRGLVAGAS